jgi:hypothetical protein
VLIYVCAFSAQCVHCVVVCLTVWERSGDRACVYLHVKKVTISITEVVYTTKVVYLPVLINPGSQFDS